MIKYRRFPDVLWQEQMLVRFQADMILEEQFDRKKKRNVVICRRWLICRDIVIKETFFFALNIVNVGIIAPPQ